MKNLALTKIGQITVRLMIALALLLAFTPNQAALAGFVATIDSKASASNELDTIKKVLEIKKVTQTLADLGYNREEIDTRLAQLSAEEVSYLAGQLDQAMTPAGDGAAGVIIAVVVVFLVVLGVLSLMGKSVVVSG
ncbi:MAG: PA2779 family protein [Deltaproteobacteria bacterium]|jgi:Holliday junction resolvasome RuvABC DNA-binding subunit|nr:PA2779 family protein [Deltaproteobacteria bacterium]